MLPRDAGRTNRGGQRVTQTADSAVSHALTPSASVRQGHGLRPVRPSVRLSDGLLRSDGGKEDEATGNRQVRACVSARCSEDKENTVPFNTILSLTFSWTQLMENGKSYK